MAPSHVKGPDLKRFMVCEGIAPMLKVIRTDAYDVYFYRNSYRCWSNNICIPQDKKLRLTLNGNRKVVGTLRGFDPFLNVVLEEAVYESGTDGDGFIGQIVIRGNSIAQFETLERIRKTDGWDRFQEWMYSALMEWGIDYCAIAAGMNYLGWGIRHVKDLINQYCTFWRKDIVPVTRSHSCGERQFDTLSLHFMLLKIFTVKRIIFVTFLGRPGTLYFKWLCLSFLPCTSKLFANPCVYCI